MGGRLWTPEQDATMRTMIAQGAGSSEIGAAIGRKAKSVIDRAYDLGLKFDAVAATKRRVEQMRRLHYAPEYAEMRKQNGKKRWTPEMRAAASEWARQHRLADLAKWSRSAEGKTTAAATARRLADKKLAWCPEALRDDYRTLLKSYRAHEARAIIMAEIDRGRAAEARAKAAYDRSFEGQLARAKAGGRVEERLVRPANDYHLTLGGVAQYG